jgi:D-alanyl-D-alanine carboxypeptidase/D-alanyl-D-alanine-endopeptidase (penicillin-binding protein 4)
VTAPSTDPGAGSDPQREPGPEPTSLESTSPERESPEPGSPEPGSPEPGSPEPGSPEPDLASPAPPRRSRRYLILPGALALVWIGAAAAAFALDAKPASSAIGADAATTPVLSPRRVPEVIAAPVAERRLAGDLQAWLGASPPTTCLTVESRGDVVFAHNATLPLAGASTQKLLTATGLLLAVGPDARLETRAVTAAPPRNGVVAGDVFVVGGGDAALGTPAWRTDAPDPRDRVVHDVDGLVDAIVAAGVTRIEGSVVGDGSRYDGERYNPAWPQRFIDQDAVGPVGGLMVNDGFSAFSSAQSAAATVPAADPAADAARVITDRLRAKGVAVVGAPRAGRAPHRAMEVASLASPPVSQIVAEMLTHSDNETAEAALKEIGLAVSGEGSVAAGKAALTRLLTDAGIALDGVQLVDGSGLSNRGRLTCQSLTELLTGPETGPVLRAGLAVAGESGTLADRWRGTPVAGRLRAKTGSLRNVTALAGEVDPLAGGTLTFAYVANVSDPGPLDPGDVNMDGLAEILVAYPRDIDLAALDPE